MENKSGRYIFDCEYCCGNCWYCSICNQHCCYGDQYPADLQER